MQLTSKNKTLDLSIPVVMGILNVTPDSFSDGGNYTQVEKAVEHALEMERQGAAIIDIGGESTRPGASEVMVAQELDRVVPVIQALRQHSSIWISIDTSKPEVMKAAVQAGADLINDVRALQLPGALEVAAELAVPVCLMHMQGSPQTMQLEPQYSNVVEEVSTFLLDRVAACEAIGISRSQIILDPGFGFGKTLEHNYQLLDELGQLVELGFPVLAGMSRKSMVARVLEKPPLERTYGDVALTTLAAERGAHIIRVHEVVPAVDAIKIIEALKKVRNL